MTVYIVNNEHHHLTTCPCKACRQERKRRQNKTLPDKIETRHLLKISPEVAYVFGYLQKLNQTT